MDPSRRRESEMTRESRSGKLNFFKDGSIWIGDSLLQSFLGPFEGKEVKIEVSEL